MNPIATYTVLPPVDVAEKLEAAEALVNALEDFDLVDDAAAERAGALLKLVHGEVTELEALRKKTKAPALEAGRDIDAFFRPALTAWKKAKGLLTRKLTKRQQEIDAENQRRMVSAARQRIEDYATGGELLSVAPVAGTAVQNVLEVHVVDAGAVPREFMIVDMTALKALARAGGKAPAGVEFRRVSKVKVGR